MILSSIVIALSPLIQRYPDLAMGITYDLTLTAPILYYLLIRKKTISNLTVVSLFLLGILLATILFSPYQKFHLNLITTYVFPLVEGAVLLISIYNIYTTVKMFKENSTFNNDFYLVIKDSLKQTFGNTVLSKVISYEICSYLLRIFSWKKSSKEENIFLNYKESGSIALLGTIIFVVFIETIIVHILLEKWSGTFAWILTISSIYLALQILGHIKAMTRRHSEISGGQLHLKYGLFSDLKTDLKNIVKIEFTGNTIEDKNIKVAKLAVLGDMEMHNVALHFSKPQVIEKPYGIIKECDIFTSSY